jgi:uncharacterized membrane protein (UPF0127 family)
MRLKRWVGSVAVIIVVAASLLFLYMQLLSSEKSTVSLSGHTYQVTVARTEADREQGLSDTASLPDGQAMLFVFPTSARPAIWMKDMNYPIDIVWLNDSQKVVYITKDAQPSSYPNTLFQPDKDSRYVIELPAGTIEKTGIKIGAQADFTVAN